MKNILVEHDSVAFTVLGGRHADGLREEAREIILVVDAEFVAGLVLGVGSILVLIGCWRLERQNDVKDATIDKLQKEIEGLKNHA